MQKQFSDSVVNFTVVVVADRYLDSAKVLMDIPKRQVLVAFVLAALSVEIYLKSFLVKRQRTTSEIFPFPDHVGQMITSHYENVVPAGMKHQLTQLFERIKSEGKAEILLQKLDIPESEFVDLLSTYEDYFVKIRYQYEENSRRRADSGVIELAEALKRTCYEIIEAQRQSPTMSR